MGIFDIFKNNKNKSGLAPATTQTKYTNAIVQGETSTSQGSVASKATNLGPKDTSKKSKFPQK